METKRTTAPKPPKRALRWGVYNKFGNLVIGFSKKYIADNYALKKKGQYVARFTAVPIATGRRAKP